MKKWKVLARRPSLLRGQRLTARSLENRPATGLRLVTRDWSGWRLFSSGKRRTAAHRRRGSTRFRQPQDLFAWGKKIWFRDSSSGVMKYSGCRRSTWVRFMAGISRALWLRDAQFNWTGDGCREKRSSRFSQNWKKSLLESAKTCRD